MKRFLLFAVVVVLFTACTQEIMVDVTNPTIADDASETLVVGFEGDDTRIQLQGGKTVWTQGDQVSVFYKSDANQKWQYNGETGSRTAELKRVDAGVASARMDRVVVAYPYSDNYLLNLTTGDIEATMPAVQTYMKDSYGLDGNIMVASSYFTQFNLKNVCGWLKLQLTGDGEVVKSIKLRGNNGEQVAGLIYVDTENATSILASEMGDVTEDEGENITGGAGGNLVFDDTILTEVTLNCGEGVTLGKSTTAFYIALPPQTFENGFTIEVECDGYMPMIISTSNSITIERNHIQPMAPKEHNATPIIPNNQIWYTAKIKAEPNDTYKSAFGATIISNEWDSETGKGIITFDGDVTKVGYQAFNSCNNFITINLPDSVTTIGNNAFDSCISLTSVNIPDSVTTIGDWAFIGCSNLREFTGKYAADGGRCLIIDNTIIAYAEASGTTYNIPDSVTTIGNYALSYCDSLTSVTIGNSVTTIGNYAFYGCTSLTSVNIPDSVTTIGSYAFSNCDSLTSVNIPDSVTTIGEGAFYDCDSLKSVYCKVTTSPALGYWMSSIATHQGVE